MISQIEAYLTLEYLLPVITALAIVAAVSRYIQRKEEYDNALSPFGETHYGKPQIKSKVTPAKFVALWFVLSATFLSAQYFFPLS